MVRHVYFSSTVEKRVCTKVEAKRVTFSSLPIALTLRSCFEANLSLCRVTVNGHLSASLDSDEEKRLFPPVTITMVQDIEVQREISL